MPLRGTIKIKKIVNVRGNVGGLEPCALWVGIKMVVTEGKNMEVPQKKNQENHDQQCHFQW